MLYGHLDKQPYDEPWDEGKHPTEPSIIDNWLYGRGGVDDGYSVFLNMLAAKIAQLQGIKLPTITLCLETEEESGSPNLLPLLDKARDIIGYPDYMICMDSGTMDYERLWMTSSLRGNLIVFLTVEAAKIGYHSGEAGGCVPETFRIARALLDRIDDPTTGRVVQELNVETPDFKKEEAKVIAQSVGKGFYERFVMHEGAHCMNEDNLEEQYLDSIWRPNVAITGAEGLPPFDKAGNVIRPATKLKISMRTSPIQDAKDVEAKLIEILRKDPPYNAKITLEGGHTGSGWCQKQIDEQLSKSLAESSALFYDGKPAASYGEGGAIPFLKELE